MYDALIFCFNIETMATVALEEENHQVFMIR